MGIVGFLLVLNEILMFWFCFLVGVVFKFILFFLVVIGDVLFLRNEILIFFILFFGIGCKEILFIFCKGWFFLMKEICIFFILLFLIGCIVEGMFII